MNTQEQEVTMSQNKGIPRALVIGGGIAGMQASLDIANAGFEVLLVERKPSIGGHMLQLSETFPTLDCAQCILTPRTVEVGQHPRIQLYTYSEVVSIEGEEGNFCVRIRRKPAYVNWDLCTGCGLCQEKCPTKVPSPFEEYVGLGKAIYTLSPQAVPNKPVIDREHCRYFTRGKCRVCERVCPTEAIDYEQQERIVEENVGAIVVATGFDLYALNDIGEYGAGEDPDILSGLQFERLLSASGPTAGAVRRPSDGKEPAEIAFVQCVRSRDPEHGMPYCSRICCMYTAKHAMLYKHRVHHGQAYVFYIDIRSAGKNYEEFVQRAMEEDDVLYIRGRVSRIFRQNGKLVVWGADTLTGKSIEVRADMVVLANAVIPAPGNQELAQALGIELDENGFFREADDNLRPMESTRPGIFIAGAAQTPKDIPDTVAQASGATAKVLTRFQQWNGDRSNETEEH
ncbi:MAG: CoB--CoM heterodisulfide reductase iron-sulfur subunit A family protein [Chloroflexia bacterium]|nr:CoB--CoM heterodisulfide reductase iron-sulfur subunit A family protein [Chloroflexia bacterium]